jgi:hypothetical protein
MEIITYFARPIECTGKVYQLVSLLIDGTHIWYPETGTQEEIYKLSLNKNRELSKSSN